MNQQRYQQVGERLELFRAERDAFQILDEAIAGAAFLLLVAACALLPEVLR